MKKNNYDLLQEIAEMKDNYRETKKVPTDVFLEFFEEKRISPQDLEDATLDTTNKILYLDFGRFSGEWIVIENQVKARKFASEIIEEDIISNGYDVYSNWVDYKDYIDKKNLLDERDIDIDEDEDISDSIISEYLDWDSYINEIIEYVGLDRFFDYEIDGYYFYNGEY